MQPDSSVAVSARIWTTFDFEYRLQAVETGSLDFQFPLLIIDSVMALHLRVVEIEVPTLECEN